MQPHNMVSDTDGALYDTRSPGWHKGRPTRVNYSRHHRDIESVSDLKATLRAGQHTSLGGYPLFFILADGATLSFEAARDNFRQVVGDFMTHDKQWRPVACEINYEDADLYCDHTGKRIPSAYAEPE